MRELALKAKLRGEVDVEAWKLHMTHSVLLVLRGSMAPRAAKALHARLIEVQRNLSVLRARR